MLAYMYMKLNELFEDNTLPATEITGLTQNSAKVKPGFVFFAVKGYSVDGHLFIDDAIKKGAVAVVSEQKLSLKEIPSILVKNITISMARAACKFYNYPSDKLKVIGLTGTKGKTSTAYLTENILFTAGLKPAVFGTINYRANGQLISQAPNTTPEPLILEEMIDYSVKQNCDTLVMEVSSHALELHRTEGINFDIALFANLQRDHLDFHLNFENYFAAKVKLFDNLISAQNTKKEKTAVINIDDEYGKKLYSYLEGKVKIITYGIKEKADLHATNIKPSLEGVDFEINGKKAHINLLGAHNVYNALGAAACSLARGISWDAILAGLNNLKGVPGRMQRVDEGQNFYVFVDFAYTNEALLRAYETLKPYQKGRLITVFGCGGQRDRTKRPLMGASATANSDIVFLTNDNPRKEDPKIIFEDILKGISDKSKVILEPSRRAAIQKAIAEAKENDIIIIAGKGHEDYQILPTGKIHFSDTEEAIEAIKNVQAQSLQK